MQGLPVAAMLKSEHRVLAVTKRSLYAVVRTFLILFITLEPRFQ